MKILPENRKSMFLLFRRNDNCEMLFLRNDDSQMRIKRCQRKCFNFNNTWMGEKNRLATSTRPTGNHMDDASNHHGKHRSRRVARHAAESAEGLLDRDKLGLQGLVAIL